MVATKPDGFHLYSPKRFNPVTRQRFFRDRRARWIAHCGGVVSDSVAILIGQVIALEWDIERLQRRELDKGRLSAHDRVALAAWRRHLREALRLIGPRQVEDKPTTVADLVADIARTKASASSAEAAA